MENAGISAIVEVCEDLWTRIHSVYWLKDEATKTEAKKVLKESYLPVVLAKLEAQIAKNNSKEDWIFGQKVCMCIVVTEWEYKEPVYTNKASYTLVGFVLMEYNCIYC